MSLQLHSTSLSLLALLNSSRKCGTSSAPVCCTSRTTWDGLWKSATGYTLCTLGRWLSQARPRRCSMPLVIPIRVGSYAPYHWLVCRNRPGHCRPCAASLPNLGNDRWDAPLAHVVRRFSLGSVMLSSFPSLTLATLLHHTTCGVCVGRP